MPSGQRCTGSLGISELRDCVQSKYLARDDDFTAHDVTVAGRQALLIVGAMTTETVKWTATLMALTSQAVSIGNTTTAAALLIRVSSDGGPVVG